MAIGQYNNWMPPTNNWGWPYNMSYQPQSNNNNINNIQQPINNLLRVTGPESAKAYSLPANSNVVLFDADNPIFYLKTTDDSGFPHLRTFSFEEIKSPEPQQNNSDFVTKNDLQTLESNISELKEMLEGLMN